jgi:ABC-type dipeptide/oligopeptide/nickel transport system permease subunit
VATTGREQQSDVLSSGAGLAADISIETHGQLGASGPESTIKARSYWGSVWMRLKRDKLALAGGVTVILMILAAFFGAPIAQHFLGHGPNDLISQGVDANLIPVGPMTHVQNPDGTHSILILGASDTLGRDEFLRLLYGARVSFEVAVLATVFGVVVGVLLGSAGGFFGGWVDIGVSRLTEIVMAFPLLLFAIALASTVGQRMNDITLGLFPPGVVSLVVVIATFSWFYPARIVRGIVLSLREKEFVEAARMTGAGDWRIIRSHLLPHLVAPTIVYFTLIVATNVLFEAGLSFLGLGIPLPTASWGNLLSSAPEYYLEQPWLMVWPGLAVMITVLGFNLLGDGLRDAFDPRSTH